MPYITDPEATIHVGIYIASSCSMLSLGAIHSPLEQANLLLGYERYKIFYIADVMPCFTISGRISVAIDYSIDDTPELDFLFIVSEQLPNEKITLRSRKFLQRLAAHSSTRLIGVQLGGYWLAASGLVQDQGLILHWQGVPASAEQFPELALSDRILDLESTRASCAGQASILDFMLHLIEKQDDEELAAQIAEWLCLARIRQADEPQRQPVLQQGGELQPRLQQALQLMAEHTEEPLATEDIARRVNLSRRHLERLFKRDLGNMPARYYLELRLKRAQQLLLSSNKSIIQIGLGCGFSSGPHFSSAYKSFFNLTPRDERNRKLKAPCQANELG
ncbi:GlxA family transcriptional regulator [Pseudaeromonas pectinilytica]